MQSLRAILQRRGLRFGRILLVCLGLIGCTNLDVRNDPISAWHDVVHLVKTVKEMKTVGDIKSSFIFQASELLFPDGLTTSPEALPKLSSEQQDKVNQFLTSRIADIYGLSAKVIEMHPEYKVQQKAPLKFSRVKFLVTGNPDAIVDKDGVVFIDVRIVQSILRSVILQWHRDGGVSGDPGLYSDFPVTSRTYAETENSRISPDVELKAIRQFNEFRLKVKKASPSMEIGMLIGLVTRPADSNPREEASVDGMFDAMANRAFTEMFRQMREKAMLSAARNAQERFESAIDFLASHELAHQAFGHALTRNVSGNDLDAEVCRSWQQQESEADEFATLVLVQRQYSESIAPTVKESSNGISIDGFGYQPNVDGGSLMLSTVYKISGLTNVLVQIPCTYPSPKYRIDRTYAIFRYSDAALSSGLYLEGVQKGSWFATKDDKRLGQIFKSAQDSGVQDVADSARIQALVEPLIRRRFAGAI